MLRWTNLRAAARPLLRPLSAPVTPRALQVLTPTSLVRHQSGGKKKQKAQDASDTKGMARARPSGESGSDAASGSGGGGGSKAKAAAASANRAGGGIEGDIVMNVRGLGKTLPGGRILFQDISLAFQRGAKIGILGLNGAGKSSLLRILAGTDTEFDGTVWRSDGLRVGFLQQEPVLDASKDVHGNIMDGLREQTTLLARYDELSAAMGQDGADLDALMSEQAEVQHKIDDADCWTLHHVATMAKQALRVPPDDADVSALSGGERRRVALCRLLLERPDVLLLDEPTNHLDATSVAWLEQYLKDYKGTVLAITHDRYFLDNVAGWILELDRGMAFPYAGNYSMWLEKKSARMEAEKKSDKKRARMMEEELAWIRQGAKARQAKSKARIARFEAMSAAAEEDRTKEKFLSGQIVIPPGPRLGEQVLEVDGVSKAVDGRTLFSDVTFSVPKGAIVGVIGANGTGKTTLLRILAGELKPDAGKVVVGKTVQMGLVSQSRQELAGDVRVLEAVCGHVDAVRMGDVEIPARQYLAAFNLVGELQTKLVRSLSGGERNRVHLARVLKAGSNFLMLDEPTNDLDVDTLRSLEKALQDYDGCAVIVSHDRYFLDRTCTHMLVFHPGGRVQWFDGSYYDYESYVRAQLKSGGAAAAAGLYVLPGMADDSAGGAGTTAEYKPLKL